VSIANYSDLVSKIQDWLARPGDATIAAIAPDLIRLSEDMFNYGYGVEGEALYMPPLRTRDMETRATITADQEYMAVPDDFLEARSMTVTGSPEDSLHYSTPQQFADAASSYTSGTPQTYTIVDGSFRFGPAPTSSSIELIYFAKIPALTEDDDTNWLLTKLPTAYLYGALFQSSVYTGNPEDDARGAQWFRMCAAILKSYQRQDRMSRYGGASLVMRPVTPTP
jgi:hypothetical protein